MRRCSALLAALIVTVVPGAARADDAASVEAGRTAGRGILLLHEPRGCAIAVLRERCIADVVAFLHGRGDGDFGNVPKVGAHPASGLRAFVRDGDRDGVDPALEWINSTQATEAQWKADPRFAALYDAGIADVSMGAAPADEVGQMFGAVPVALLALHADQIPAGALPIDPAPLRALHMTRPNAARVLPFARNLVRAVRTAYAPPPLAPLAHGDGAVADALLGVDVATAAELLDIPPWGWQDDAQRFIAAVADRIGEVVPAVGKPAVTRFRVKSAAGTAFDAAAAGDSLQSAIAVWDAAVPIVRRQRFALGSGAAQLAFNAASTRTRETARNLLIVLAGSDVLDGAVPGWKDVRAAGAALGPSDWRAQHDYAIRLVELIEKANGA